MENALKNLFAVTDLRNRVLFTLALLGVYRIGSHIPTPGVNTEALAILAEIVLVPAANARRLQLNTKMLPRLEAMGVDVDGVEFGFQDPTPLDRSGRLEAMQLCPEAFTVNEFREVAGLPALSGGEVYLRQADHWEEVDAGQIIDITPIRRSATPPPLPSPLSHVPNDQPIVRLIINQAVA